MVNTQTSIIQLYNYPPSGEFSPGTDSEAAEGSLQELQASEATSISHMTTPPSGKPPGYPRLAGAMNLTPEMAIFRRFGELNALNLLYLQAELMDIEQRLQEAQAADHSSPNEHKSLYSKNWYYLRASAQDGDDEQLRLAELAREKLEKYNAALVHQEKILAMKTPGAYDMDCLQKFLASAKIGEPYALTGLDANIWGSHEHPRECEKDLVTLKPRQDEDIFSNWVTGKGISKFFELGCARRRKPSPDSGLIGYEETTLLRLTYNITSALASLLPISSIAILSVVPAMKLRLAIIAIFNLALSVCLIAFTTAKRTDVFAVTSAFAAVQVVFVQGNSTESAN